MSKVAKKPDPWDQSVPTISDSALETVDGKDPGLYKRFSSNGPVVSRELTVEIGVALTALSLSLLTRMIKVIKLPNVQNVSNKIVIIEALQDTVIRSGVKELVARMSRATMKKLSMLFSLQSTKQRNIVDCILRIGLPTFLHEKCDIPLFVDFCSTLGLQAGNFDPSHSIDDTPSHSDPHPPSISSYPRNDALHSDKLHDSDEAHKSTSQTQLSLHPDRFLPKSSVELERELADEIMLLGTEDLLKSFTGPVLHDMCVEFGLISSVPTPSSAAPLHASFTSSPRQDPFTLINLVMDHIFDLVPLDEYSRTHLQSLTSHSSHTASSSPPNTLSQSPQQVPSSPFLNIAENAKKRKREENDTSVNPKPSVAGSIATPQSSQSKPLPSSPSAPKKAKYAEEKTNEDHIDSTIAAVKNDASSSDPSKTTDNSAQSSSMDTDLTTTPTHNTPSDGKKSRPGRPASSPKLSPAPIIEETSPSGTIASTTTSNGSRTGRGRGNSAQGTKPVTESITKPVEDQVATQSASEDDIASPKRRSTRGGGGGTGQTSKSKSSPSASSGVRSSKTSSGFDEDYDEDSSEESMSSSEEEARPTSTGKGRAKYQAPPLSNIKKGVTGQDLHNLYNVTDLQDWCKQNKVDHTGKKSAVIKRILYTLDPVNAKPPPPKKTRRFSSR